MKALVLAGSAGSRLRPLTHTEAKQLIPVANKPIIYYGLEDIAKAGITDVGVIIGSETVNGITNALSDGSRWNVSVAYIYEEKPLGLAHCVKVAQNFIGDEPFLMYPGDCLLEEGLRRFVDNFKKDKPDASVLVARAPDPGTCAKSEISGSGNPEVFEIAEKSAESRSDPTPVGIYLFNSAIIKAVSSVSQSSSRAEPEIGDAIQWLIDNGYRVSSHVVEGWWKTAGKCEDVLDANYLILSDLKRKIAPTATVDENSKITGEVELMDGVVIKNSTIRGPVTVGERTRVVDSFIGPYTSIYYDCMIQGSEIEYSIVLEKTTIENIPARLDWCLIGKEVQICRNGSRPKAMNLILGDRSKVALL
jgi:glucose-1-phosphate thymidylyltransferase